MENPINKTAETITNYLLQDEVASVDSMQNLRNGNAKSLVKFHNEKLKNGDISFQTNRYVWKNYSPNAKEHNFKLFSMFEDKDDEEIAKMRKHLLAEISRQVVVERLTLQNERCFLFVERTRLTAHVLRQVLANENKVPYGQLKKNPLRRIRLAADGGDESAKFFDKNISLYRAKLLRDIIRRVLPYSEWIVEAETETCGTDATCINLEVCSAANKTGAQALQTEFEKLEGCATMTCGIVLDPSTRKMCQLETQEYINLRSNDMQLMAMHKYGLRMKDDAHFCALIKKLGAAAVTVDFVEVKYSSPVQILRNAHGSTRGASFILYNSARIETLIRTFEERVKNSTYHQLPDINEVDFTLLKEEEEWQLIFGYIFAFPNLIEHCVENLDQGICAAHMIVRFLTGFMSTFSIYYRRIRILTEKREQLMPYVYARMYLIQAVREILNKILALLDIEPVKYM